MREKSDGDRRVQRTRHMLSEALFALIIERGYESITVQDIAERANVGRATFYLHYREKEALLEDSLLSLADELTKSIDLAIDSPAPYQALSIHFFQHIAEQRKLYSAMLKGGGPPLIIATMNRCLAFIIQRRVLTPLYERSNKQKQIDPQLLAVHAAGSLLALATWWLEHDLSPSAAEMGHLFWQLLAPGIESLLELKNGRA